MRTTPLLPLLALVGAVASPARAERCPPATPALGADGRTFPSKLGPALSGELAALRWGMSLAELDKASPRLAKAIHAMLRDRSKERGNRDTYVPFAGGAIKLQVLDAGLSTIYLRYPSRAAALKALAAWGAPAAPQNPQQFEFWTSDKGRARGLLRPDDEGRYVVELAPFTPLAERIATLLSPSGKPLLGLKQADLCLPALDERMENLVVPASERSSGYYPYRVTWKDGVVASFVTQLDYTYDRTVRDQIPKLLADKFGKPTRSRNGCDAYGTSPTIYACNPRGITVWTIHVGKEP